jgi:hypothetical protein
MNGTGDGDRRTSWRRSRGLRARALAAALALAGAGATAAEDAATPAPAGPPLLTFAWLSDLHLDVSRAGFIARALRYVRESVRPDFALFTGDDNAIPAPDNPARPEPEPVRRQRHFAAFLGEHLRLPAVVIPGDNWPHGFETVFGAVPYSFDAGGLHFLMLAPDRSWHGKGMEGLSVFNAGTWDWIRRDLEASRGRPTLVAIHEPVHPPTFLDAAPLRDLIDRSPHVVAVLQGHLHADLDFRPGGRAWLVAPALGPSPRPAFKRVRVHREGIELDTVEYRKAEDRFVVRDGRQWVAIPEALRAALARPEGGFVPLHRDAAPLHAHEDDPGLAARQGELMKNLWKAWRAGDSPSPPK